MVYLAFLIPMFFSKKEDKKGEHRTSRFASRFSYYKKLCFDYNGFAKKGCFGD